MKRSAITILLSLLSTLCALPQAFSVEPPAQIAISPPKCELKLGNEPLNESIRLINMKRTPVTFKVDVYNWTIDEQNQVKVIPATSQSLDNWMIINPLLFTVPPGKTQIIRFSIRPRSKPEPGEHRAIIYLTEQAAAEADTTQAGGIKVLLNYRMAIYADTDPVKHTGKLASLTFDKTSATLKADIVNNGNVRTRLEGDYSIWKPGTFPGFKAMGNYLSQPKSEKKPEGLLASGSLNSAPVLPGQRRTVSTPVGAGQSKGGSYVLAVKGMLDDKPIEKLFP
jgi:fimbrial chaperone protein